MPKRQVGWTNLSHSPIPYHRQRLHDFDFETVALMTDLLIDRQTDSPNALDVHLFAKAFTYHIHGGARAIICNDPSNHISSELRHSSRNSPGKLHILTVFSG